MNVSYVLKSAHAEAAAVHAAVALGLLDDVVSASGVRPEALAERRGISGYAARVLTQVLRIGDGLRRTDGGDLRPGPGLDAAALTRLWQATTTARAQWGALGDLTDALRAGDASTGALLADVPAADETATGADWLLDRARWGHVRTRALSAATELGVPAALATGPLSTVDLAGRAGVSADTLGPLLDALVRLGFLGRTADGWTLAGELAGVLQHRRGADALLLGAQLAHQFWPALARLEHTARTGELTLDLQDKDIAARYYLSLARYNSLLFPTYLALAGAVASGLAGRAPGAARVVDVGAGSGVWGAAFARAWPQATVRFLDRPKVLTQSRANAQRLGIADRAEFAAVDLTVDELAPGDADVLVLGQICHTQPVDALPDLMERCARALRPHGVLVLADMVLDPTGSGPVPYLHFAVKEFVATAGAILDLTEYRQLLAKAGFEQAHRYRFDGLDVLLAARDGGPMPALLDGCLAYDPPEGDHAR